MADYFVFDMLNSALRLLVTALLAYKLYRFYDNFKPIERIGIALIASGSFLTIPPLLPLRPNVPVFDGWAVSVMTFGILLHFVGRIMRHIRHNRANDAQVRYYDEYFKGKNNGG